MLKRSLERLRAAIQSPALGAAFTSAMSDSASLSMGHPDPTTPETRTEMGELTGAPAKSACHAEFMAHSQAMRDQRNALHADDEEAMETENMTKTTRNGLDLAVLHEAVDELRDDPEAATVTMRTRHTWDNGFAVNGSTIEIEQGGEVTTRTFTFRTDWPPVVGGRDSGPSPGEAILGALGGCVAMAYIKKAARGVDIEELEVRIDATVDLRGAFELDAVRAGLARAVVIVRVRSNADDAVLDDLGQTVTHTSAVYDSLANPVPNQLAVQRLP
jgi:putative redox protein